MYLIFFRMVFYPWSKGKIYGIIYIENRGLGNKNKMEKIIEYIKQCQALGLARDVIDTQLLQAGWREEEIAFAWTRMPAPKPVAIPAAMAPQEGRRGFFGFFHPSRKIVLITSAVLGILVLGAGGAYAYFGFYASPEKIWNKALLNTTLLESGHVNVSGTYADHLDGAAQVELNGDFFGSAESLEITLKADGDFRAVPDAQTDFALVSNAGFKIAGFNVGADFETRKVGQNFYYKLRNNFLGMLFGNLDSDADQPAEWLKIDLSKTPPDEANEFFSKLTQEQLKEIQNAAKTLQIVKLARFVGKESQDNVALYRYEAAIDKESLRTYIERVTGILYSGEEGEKPDVQPLLDKLEVKKLEVWIGKKDAQIRRVILETTMPSIMSSRNIIADSSGATAKSRDARRVADARQIMTALELFFNDNSRYPAAKDGFPDPTDGEVKFTSYIAQMPTAPTPPDGDCTVQDNYYWYEQVDNGQDYKLTFCVGYDIGGFYGGKITASSSGMVSQGLSSKPIPGQQIMDLLATIPFSATLSLDIQLTNLNGQVQIEEPAGALDYYQKIEDAEETRNIRTVMTALELYYNDNSSYPAELAQLSSVSTMPYFYTDSLPKAVNTQGECAGISEDYNYTSAEDRQTYSMDFCLESDSGGFSKGKHRASQMGIE